MSAANDDDGSNFEDDLEELIPGAEAIAGLRALARLARLLPNIDWFSQAGRPIKNTELIWAESYCAGLGFIDVNVSGLEGWREAAALAAEQDWDAQFWEAEEQAHQALLEQAEQWLPSYDLEVALNHVAMRATELAQIKAVAAAARAGIVDEGLIRAAAQAAGQAAYQAALVLAAQGNDYVEDDDSGEEHAFAAKFRLFEAGRWPLGLVGNTFTLF